MEKVSNKRLLAKVPLYGPTNSNTVEVWYDVEKDSLILTDGRVVKILSVEEGVIALWRTLQGSPYSEIVNEFSS